MFKQAAIALLAVLLIGCEKPVQTYSEVRDYTVVEVHPPKRMYVNLADVKTGAIHHVYVAKRCPNWKQLEVGSLWTFHTTVDVYEDGDSNRYFHNKAALCPRN